MKSRHLMAAASSIRRSLPTHATLATRNPLSSARSPHLSHPVPVHHPATPTRRLATLTIPSPHPAKPLPANLPGQPGQPGQAALSPSQLRATSAARAQQAVSAALAFEEQRASSLQRRNAALGLACVAFVVWCYWFSVHSVRSAADSLTGTDVAEVERELDVEERAKA